LAVLALLLSPTLINLTQAQPAADIVALKTREPLTAEGTHSESFWSQIQAINVPLTGTTPYGGKVPYMLIKAAHNASFLFLQLQWPDDKESRRSDRAKRIDMSTPGNLSGRYFYNETYYYTDAAAITWWLGGDRPSVSPATNDEFGGAPTRRASLFGWSAEHKAELMMWKAYALDRGNPGWPYSGIIPTGLGPGESKWTWGPNVGQPYTMPYSAGFQGLYNATGNWVMGDGLLHAKGCQIAGTKPFEIRARGVWSGGMWTLELARPFESPPENKPYTATIGEGETYWLVSAAFDGNRGEWEEVASMSKWLSLSVSTDLVPSERPTTTSTQVTTTSAPALDASTIAYAAAGLAVVALAVFVVMRLKRRKA